MLCYDKSQTKAFLQSTTTLQEIAFFLEKKTVTENFVCCYKNVNSRIIISLEKIEK